MKKTFTVIALVAVVLIIFAAYFGIYGIEIPEEYAVVSTGFEHTLTITLLAAAIAHIAAILPGVLLGKAGMKTAKIVSCIPESLSVVAPFLVSAVLILLAGKSFYVIVGSVALPLFIMSVSSIAENTATVREKNLRVHKLAISGAKYFKNYTVPFIIAPYFAKAMQILRTAFYTVVLLEALNILGVTNLGGLIGHNNTGISGIAIAVAGIFVLLIQLLCMLTKQKEETK